MRSEVKGVKSWSLKKKHSNVSQNLRDIFLKLQWMKFSCQTVRLEIYELTYEECMELVASGAIQDAKTIIALQYYALHFGGK